MRGRSPLIASLTLVAFTTLVIWPRGASAEGDAKTAPAEAAPATAAPAPTAGGDDATAAGTAHPGYDPYASQAPPGHAPGKPVKKKSYWWIGLIIAGGVLVTVGLIVLAVWAESNATTTTTFADHAGMTQLPSGARRM